MSSALTLRGECCRFDATNDGAAMAATLRWHDQIRHQELHCARRPNGDRRRLFYEPIWRSRADDVISRTARRSRPRSVVCRVFVGACYFSSQRDSTAGRNLARRSDPRGLHPELYDFVPLGLNSKSLHPILGVCTPSSMISSLRDLTPRVCTQFSGFAPRAIRFRPFGTQRRGGTLARRSDPRGLHPELYDFVPLGLR